MDDPEGQSASWSIFSSGTTYNGEWDQAVEAITGVLATDRNNTEALRIYIFYLLARENDTELV